MEKQEKKESGISRIYGRSAAVFGMAIASTLALTGVSLATPAYTDPASVITPAGSQLKTDLLAVAGGVAVLGVVILGVKKGWGLMKRFF